MMSDYMAGRVRVGFRSNLVFYAKGGAGNFYDVAGNSIGQIRERCGGIRDLALSVAIMLVFLDSLSVI
jgi:hypothetical protein